MEDKTIDLGILKEQGDDFNLEDYYTLIERKKLEAYSMGVYPESIEKLEDSLTKLDRVLQDLKSSNDRIKVQTWVESSRTLTVWYESIKTVDFDRNITFGLIKNVSDLTVRLNKINGIKKVSTRQVDSELSSMDTYYKRIGRNPKKIKSSELIKLFRSNPTEGAEDVNILKHSQIKESAKRNKTDFIPLYSWELNINISSDEDANKIFYFLWTLTEAISKIDGARIIIQNIEKGSIKVKLKLLFKNILAKKEVKEVIDKAVRAGHAVLDKPALEGEKIKSETELIKRQTEAITDPEIKFERENLENQKIKAEIDRANAETFILKVQGIQKLSDLIRDGIISIDKLQIDINGMAFLVKNKDNIEIQSDLDFIDSKSNLEKGN